jgi:hypothetical protein
MVSFPQSVIRSAFSDIVIVFLILCAAQHEADAAAWESERADHAASLAAVTQQLRDTEARLERATERTQRAIDLQTEAEAAAARKSADAAHSSQAAAQGRAEHERLRRELAAAGERAVALSAQVAAAEVARAAHETQAAKWAAAEAERVSLYQRFAELQRTLSLAQADAATRQDLLAAEMVRVFMGWSNGDVIKNNNAGAIYILWTSYAQSYF